MFLSRVCPFKIQAPNHYKITEIHYRKILNMHSQRSVLGKKSSEKSVDVGAEPLSSNCGVSTY